MERVVNFEGLEQLASRLTAAPLSTDKLTICSHQGEGFTRFVEKLSKYPHSDRGKLLYSFLNELQTLSITANEKLKLLNTVREATLECSAALAKTSLCHKTAKAISLSQALLKHLSGNYRSVIKQFLTNGARSLPYPLLAQSILFAMEALSLSYLRSNQFYIAAPTNLWINMHSLHRIAVMCKLDSVPNPGKARGGAPSVTIHTEYMRVLLLACGHPNHLSSNDLTLVYNALKEWAPMSQLARGHTTGIYMVDIDANQPPVYVSEQPGQKKSYYRIYLEPLLENLATKLQNFPNARVIDTVPPRLIRSLCEAWSYELKRQLERTPNQRQQEIIYGLPFIHSVVSGVNDFADFLSYFGEDGEQDHTTNVGEVTPLKVEEINSSSNGFCFELSGEHMQRIVPGELVAIRDDEHWQLGIVRWKHTTPRLSALIGVELQHGKLTSCASRTNQLPDKTGTFIPALLLVDKELSGRQLIVPTLTFKQGDRIQLIDSHGNNTNEEMTALLESTGSICSFVLAAANYQQSD
ncbi:hypothetical protein QP938_02155 [Porticoccaceae bacterium LTM1]|nr:hypothetical protein QP938_02155 [Porticoccaceae bacterium LTM1]